jgi:SAM-dependent methyltransferase
VSQHAGDFEAADLRAELEHRGAIQRWQGSGEVFVIWQQTAPSDPRRFYTEAYQTAGADERERLGRWRALGARIKVDHVLRLWQRAGLRPAAVAEIGCGDGSLLADLSRRAALTVLDGFDVSDSAVEMARARGLPAVRVECFDGRRVPAADDAYDVAILSHVVEHIEDPAPVLEEAARIAPWVLVEVPLEDNRSGARREKRDEAARIGHVLFLDRPALHELLDAAGLDVREDLSDPLPFSHVAFFADGRRARAKGAVKTVIRRAVWLGSPQLAERWFTLHYACLARRRR